MPDETSEGLGQFFDKIWHDTEAYVYIATLEKGTNFKQFMLRWPEQRPGIIRHVLALSAAGSDVYFSPALYKAKRPTKDNVLGSWVQWADFDHGTAPKDWSTVAAEKNIPEPTLIVQSSVEGNQHAYWGTESFDSSVEGIEDRNRALAYRLGADTSGWDADQLLRPPYTANYGYRNPTEHKPWFTGEPAPVTLCRDTDSVINRASLSNLGTPEKEYLGKLNLGELPELDAVLALGSWSPEFYAAFRMTKEEAAASSPDKRSGALMRLAYLGAENGFSDEQIYVILDDADKRWEKYVSRSKAGREKVLHDTIARARAKVGYLSDEILEFTGLLNSRAVVQEPRLVYSFQDFLNTDVKIDWLVDGFLSQGGMGVITGQPGVGKTQFGIQLAATLALGAEKFLIWDNQGAPRKVLFLSLEMSHAPLKHFMDKMAGRYKDLRTLDRNMHIAPLGQSIPLDTKRGQDFLNNLLIEYRPDVVFIDSLQKVTSKELTDELAAKALVEYLKVGVRDKYGTAVYLVHHNRKKSNDSSRHAGELSEMYGSQFIAAELDMVTNLRRLGESNILSVDCWKNRLAMMWRSFDIMRDDHLQFDLYDGGVTYIEPLDGGDRPDHLSI